MSTDMLEDSLYEQDVATAKSRSDMMFCPECHSPNPATRKFCVNCGTALWEPCFRCETLCPADGNFCGSCGADLRGTAAMQVRQFDAQLNAAESLRANLEFEEALEILKTLASNDHPRLMERVRRVEQLIEQVTAEQERREAEAAQALIEAEELVGRYRYQEAALKLEAVPKPLRSEALESLLEQAAATDAEIGRLIAELRRDLQTHLDDQVFRKLMRVLQLQPDHEQGVQLNKTLQGRLFKQSREYLAAFRYADAAALLEQIPEATQLPAVKSLCTLAVEMAWLWSDLRQSPHVDQTLLESARRLCKLSPKHAKAAELRDELERRLKTAEKAEGIPPILPWAAARRSPGAAPLTWLPDFRRLELTDDCDPAPLVENRGVFFTAAGLALQGLGLARIHVNLRAEAGNAVLNKMRSLLSSQPQSAWGIDVGSHALKAVHLVVDRKDKLHRPRIAKVVYVRYAKDLCRAVNDDQRNELIVEALHELVAESESLAKSRVCVGLSSRLVFSRLLDIPAVEKSKIGDLVLYEARHHVPMKLDDLTWGYQRINEDKPPEDGDHSDAKGKAAKLLGKRAKPAPEKKRSRHKVLLLLIKGEDAIRRLAPFRELGIRVDVAQSESVALYNALNYELTTPPHPQGEPGEASKTKGKPDSPGPEAATVPAFVAIDIGGESTAIVIGGPECLWVRQLHQSAESYTRCLVQEFQLTFEQAERTKHRPEMARSLAPLFRVLNPITDDLAEQIARMAKVSYAENGGFLPSKWFLVGGGARLHGLVSSLDRALPDWEKVRQDFT